EQRHVVEADRLGGERPLPFAAQLEARAEVDHVAQTEAVAQHADVGGRQVMEGVAAVEPAGAHAAAVARRNAAQVAEVEAALEDDALAHASLWVKPCRSTSATPIEMAASATLNIGQWRSPQCRSRKSITSPKRTRQMRLPTAPPRMPPSAPSSQRWSAG